MPTPPAERAPPLAGNCHFHIFGPYDRFPLDPGRRSARALRLGTDRPHPGITPVPDAGRLLDQLFAWVPDATTRERVLVRNPSCLYGFPMTTN